MKKNGFTLSELLIAVGVVGIIAAITLTSIHKITPDKDKGAVLKVFTTVSEINNDIFNNPSLYMINYSAQTLCSDNGILNCTDAPLDGNHSTAIGDNKYPTLLMENLSLNDVTSIYNFQTTDGITWDIDINKSSNVISSYTITITTGNNNRDNCIYSAECRNPGQFSLRVTQNGNVEGVDALTRAYLENPDELNNRTADLRRAAELL